MRFLLIGWIFCVTGLILSSCGWNTEDTGGDGADSALYIRRADLATVNELQTLTGKTYVVRQTPMLDSSLVNLVADVYGFGDDTLTFDFGEVDPVLELRTEDLDHDGFQELYVVTQSVGPEKYGTILGLYSAQDSSVVVISFEGATPYTLKEGEPYAEYAGHDRFRFEKGNLTNTFPVDGNQEGTYRSVKYELVKGTMTMRLRPARK
jgi:hypothetical protein